MNAKREFQEKIGKKWETLVTTGNETQVYKMLADCLISKKINKCTYIKSIKRVQNYNGTITIIVNYDNQNLYGRENSNPYREVYTIADH